MLRNACIAMLLCVCIYSNAQNLISGAVIDEDGKPLIGANVVLQPGNKTTVTNTVGQFIFDNIESGDYTLQVSFLGFETSESEVHVASKSTTVNFKLQEKMIVAEEVVVQASRAEENSPVTFKNVDKKEISQIYVGQDAPMVIERTTPSVMSYSESGSAFSNYSYFTLRGIDMTRVNITLNGVPLNDMIDQGVFFSNFTDLSNNIESMQVQRGVGTSTNGTASYAGSVSFESPHIYQDSASADMQLIAGSFNTYRGSFGLKTGVLKNKTAFYSRFTTFQSDGYRYHTGTVSKSFYGSAAYFGDRDMLKLNMFMGRSQNGLGYYVVAKSDIDADPRTNYLNENDKDDFGQWLLHLQHSHKVNSNTNLVTSVYYQGAGGDYLWTDFDNGGSMYQINYPLRNDHFGIMSNASYISDDNALKLDGGIHFYTFLRKNWEQYMPDKANPYYSEKSRKDEISAFGKASYKIAAFTFYGDMQLRQLQLEIEPDKTLLPDEPNVVKDWTFLNPKIGIIYTISDELSVYGTYGQTSREPTKIDLFGGYQLTPGNLSYVLGDSITYETVDDIEAGLNIHNKIVNAQLNAFYMKFKNELAPIGVYVEEYFLQLRKNMPESYRMGIEFDATAKIIESLSLNGNFTLMKSEIKTYAPEGGEIYHNVRPALTPEIMGAGGVNYSVSDFFKLGIDGKYVGSSYLEPTNNKDFMLPSYFVMDATASILWKDKWQLDLFVNNILDKQFFTYGAPVDVDWNGTWDEPGYLVNPPRNFYVKLTLNF